MNKTNHRGSSLPVLAVYNLDGAIVATSYLRHASGKIQFWHIKKKRTLSMSACEFAKRYVTKAIT